MNDEYRRARTKSEADNIKEKIKGGKLYGTAIDLDNPDEVILAAYLLGQSETRQAYLDDQERIRMIRQLGER